MRIIQDIADLTDCHGGTFIPTMGALHEGHLALIRRAVACDQGPVIASIFVNPTQFGPDEDYQRYPRTFETDVALSKKAGAEVIFAPSVEVMYPDDAEIASPALPAVATEPGLEDACRPGHLEGVCQVVARLFDLVRPRVAIFGEKDYQQLMVIKAMVAQQGSRWGDLEIIGHETIRESDGLAMSSRNAYLDETQREQALGLSRALHEAIKSTSLEAAESAMPFILEKHGLETEYAVVRDAENLMPVETLAVPSRALIAARLGSVRLIDNMALPMKSS